MGKHPYLLPDRPMVIAHRGDSAHAPENSLLALDLAAQLGVDALEMDIHATSDGVLVVAHDETLARMTDGRGLIKETTWAELRRLDAGYHFSAATESTNPYPFRGQGLYLPRLEEVVERFPTMRLNIDIKQTSPAIVQPFAALIKRYQLADRLMVGSFDHQTVEAFRAACPDVGKVASVREVRTFFLLHKLGLAARYRPRPDAFQIPELAGRIQLTSPRFVRDLQQLGIDLHIWTVNEPADMRRLLSWGVNGLISDYPAKLLQLSSEKR